MMHPPLLPLSLILLLMMLLAIVATTRTHAFTTNHLPMSVSTPNVGVGTSCASRSLLLRSRLSSNSLLLQVASRDKIIEDDDDIQILWDDEDDDNTDDDESTTSEVGADAAKHRRRRARWEQLDPKYKSYLIQKGQQRAIANKKKNEPNMQKKRKILMYMKEQQRLKKKAAKIQRPYSVGSTDRIALEDIEIGKERKGTVISLTNFGAYVDVGTTVDGLLHVSQLSNDVFVEHPRQLLRPGQEILVRVRSTNPQLNKLHLTMLPPEVLEAQRQDEADTLKEERITLEEIQIDDELWGQLKRVTDFGAYVEVGATVDGWLHFMDHPIWDGSMHPSEFMKRGERVRVWVSDIDRNQNRLKLTANRPSHLPGPRREFF